MTLSIEFKKILNSTNSHLMKTLQKACMTERLIMRKKKRCNNIRLKTIKVNLAIANEIWAPQFYKQKSTSDKVQEERFHKVKIKVILLLMLAHLYKSLLRMKSRKTSKESINTLKHLFNEKQKQKNNLSMSTTLSKIISSNCNAKIWIEKAANQV